MSPRKLVVLGAVVPVVGVAVVASAVLRSAPEESLDSIDLPGEASAEAGE